MSLQNLGFLYRSLVLDHSQHPHHYVDKLPSNLDSWTLHNPTCGDTVNVGCKIDNDKVKDLCFNGSGCLISQASASIMTDVLGGKSVKDAHNLIHDFSQLVMGNSISDADKFALGDAAVLGTVAKFPTRIRCAMLAWHAVDELLKQEERE